MSNKIVIKIKKKKLYDEYILTNKHIICQFKYLTLCFEPDSESDKGAGLVCLQKESIQQLLTEQNINLDSEHESSYMYPALKALKEWHPQISNVKIDLSKIYDISNLDDYNVNWNQYGSYLQDYIHNNCIHDEVAFEIFKKSKHTVLDIAVYFKLVKKINHVSEYHVNFQYLHQLLTEQIILLNNEYPIFLDETSISKTQMPFKNTPDEPDEPICYVYPYLSFIPLS